MKTNIHSWKLTAAVLATGFTLGYCAPVPAADDDFWANQDRADRSFDRYKADSDAYADRLDRQVQEQQRSTADALLCSNPRSTLCRAYGSPPVVIDERKRRW